jgi:VWFA-related protein
MQPPLPGRAPQRSHPALALLIVLAAGSGLEAQTVGQDLFFDAVEVHVVNVEVVVTDRDGNPVTGLQREDFELYEDGERVDLTHFFAVVARQAGEGQLADPVAADLLQKPETERLNLVIFVDNFNLRPESRNALFGELRDYLTERLDSRDRVMIVTLDDTVQVALGFTNDSEALLATLARLEREAGRLIHFDAQQQDLLRRIQSATLMTPQAAGGLSSRYYELSESDAGRMAQEVTQVAEQRVQRVRFTVEALRRFTDSLAGLGGRKALLYVSDGIPVRPADSLARAWVSKFESWILRDMPGLSSQLQEMTSLEGSSRYDVSDLIDGLTSHASANRVAFYPISSSGRAMGRGTSLSAESAGITSSGGGGGSWREVTDIETTTREMALLQLAEGTGGVAFTRTANIGGLLDRIEKDFTTFYSLGFSPAEDPGDRLRRIEVRLPNRRGLQVRHLKGVQQRDPLSNLQDLTLSALHYSLQDNPLEVRLQPGEPVQTGRNAYRVPVMVQVPFQKLLLIPDQEVHAGQLTLFVVARDQRGDVSAMQRVELPIRIPNEQLLEALRHVATYPMELEMRPGAQTIAVGVRDHLGRVDSTVYLDLVVGGAGG